MDATRRQFLVHTGRLSLVVGLSDVLLRAGARAQELEKSAASRPRGDAWVAALERMRAERKPAIVLRFPADAAARDKLVKAIDDAFGIGIDHDACELFSEAVVVCLESDAVDRRVEGARAEENAWLLSDDGKLVEGATLAGAELAAADLFVARLRRLLHGEKNARLRERAAAARRTAPKDLLARFDAFAAERPTPEEETYRPELSRALAPIAAVVALARAEATDKQLRRRLGVLFCVHLDAFEERDPGPVLPYGLALVEGSSNGCGAPIHGKNESGIACGMAEMTKASRRFVGSIAR